MKIKINGEEKLISKNKKNISLDEILNILGYDSNTVVVELNNLIVNSDNWKKQNVEEEDKLEIVSIVGGG